MTTTWHADEELLSQYATGDIDAARAYSVEAHLLACEECRSGLAGAVETAGFERMWAEVAETIDTPRAGLVEQALMRLGVREHVARLLSATPSLRLSWFAAEAIALGFAVFAADAAAGGRREDLALLLFLMVAALLPVAGVAAAYGPGMDPTYEVGLSAPMRSFRLLLIRSAAVLGTSAVLAGMAALALPQIDWTAAAWLLPSLGLTLATLAFSTYVRPLIAAGAVTFAWISISVAAAFHHGDRLIVFRGGGQIAFLLIVAVSALVIARRREAFEMGVRE